MSMIAVPIPNDLSEILRNLDVPGKRDPSDHCTVFYLGDDLPFEIINECIPAIHNITSKQKPFIISLKNYTSFDKGKHGFPVICRIKSDELVELRNKIKKELDDAGIEYSKKFPSFKPHITLSYNKDEVNNCKFSEIAWQVNKIGLYCGDQGKQKIYVEFEFGGNKKFSSRYIKDLSSQFVKLAYK